jgi:Cu/Ag efflux pump CusA
MSGLRQLVTFALQKRALVILLFVAFMGAGFAGFARLNIEAYPDPVPPTVVVITQNPGQSAAEIERYITILIEVGLSGIPNLAKVRSTSLFGLAVVSAQFTCAFTYDQSLQQVLNRLGQINLPGGVQPQISPWSPIGEIMRYRVVARRASTWPTSACRRTGCCNGASSACRAWWTSRPTAGRPSPTTSWSISRSSTPTTSRCPRS